MSNWTPPGGAPPPGPGGPPPGPTPGPTPVVALVALRPLKGLATALLVLFIVAGVVALIFLALAVGMRSELNDHIDGRASGQDAVDAINTFQSGMSFLFLTGIVVTILLIIWMWRVAKNNEAMGRTDATFAPGFAIGGWFIPLANLVIPILQLQQLWQGADASVPRGDPGWRRVSQSGLLWVWWIAYVVATVVATAGIAQIGSFLPDEETATLADFVENSDRVDTAVTLLVIAMLVLVAACVLGALSVRRLSERQTAAAAAVGLTTAVVATAPTPAQAVIPAAAGPPPGWHPDPLGRFDHRYWDGSRWTDQVSRGGQVTTDPAG